MVSSVTVLTHGRHTIRAGKLNERFVARAFLPGAKGSVLECGGTNLDAAIAALKSALDDKDRLRRKARRPLPEHQAEVPTPDEFLEALSVMKITDELRTMLKAHRSAGARGLTAGELAQAGGYQGYETANLHYGKLARAVAEYLSVPVPRSSIQKDREIPTLLFAIDGAAPRWEFCLGHAPRTGRSCG